MGAPSQVIGRYAIHGKIASGGMASVHFGRLLGAAGFERTVAVKRLHPHLAEDPEFLATMIDEARLAARIHHPNVVPTLDVVSTGGELLVVMEYVRGESLSRLLRIEGQRGRRVPLPIVSAIVIGALHGLHAAHEATSDRGTPLGIVHRDVSPQNILAGVDGVARVIDFGVAKAAGRLQTTREGVVKGKIGYMAPEQLANTEVARQADVYAMAVVLWEMLAGKRLFQADADAAVLVQVLAGAQDSPSRHAPDLAPELDALVMKGLARDPAARFPTARDMAEVLLRVVPPAFPTDVGAWVEATARLALAERSQALAEIEKSSGAHSAPPPAAAAAIHAAAVRQGDSRESAPDLAHAPTVVDDAPTVTSPSQPSSLSVETPQPGAQRRWRFRRVLLAGAVGAGLLLAAVVAFVASRGGGSSSARSASAAAASAASAPAPPSSAPQVAPAGAAPTAATEPPASASSVRRAPPPASRPRTHPALKPAGPIRFAQPD